MAYRLTDTNKWNDTWFCELKPSTKLLFLYLCDQCDIAGFLEINIKKIAFDLGIGKQEVESGLVGIKSRINYSKDGKYIFLRNFLRHQKSYPLNEKSSTYKRTVEALESKLSYYDYQSIVEFFDGGSTPPPPGGQPPSIIGSISSSIEGVQGGDSEDTKQEKKFKAFMKWIEEHAPNVNKMKQPFTFEEYERLRKDFDFEQIKDMILRMHNWKDLVKKNVSANLTFRQWAKR